MGNPTAQAIGHPQLQGYSDWGFLFRIKTQGQSKIRHTNKKHDTIHTRCKMPDFKSELRILTVKYVILCSSKKIIFIRDCFFITFREGVFLHVIVCQVWSLCFFTSVLWATWAPATWRSEAEKTERRNLHTVNPLRTLWTSVSGLEVPKVARS